DEDQATSPVRLRDVISLNVPVAVNAWVLPTATLAGSGVTAIDTSSASVTVRAAVPVTPSFAVIVAAPFFKPVARPCESSAFEICATSVSDEDQVTSPVRSRDDVALN